VVNFPISGSRRVNLVIHHLVCPQEVPADQSASQRRECLVDVGSLVIAHSQTTKLIEPRKCPFYYPAMPTHATAMFSVSLRESGVNSTHS
jgi:hypothetical protein